MIQPRVIWVAFIFISALAFVFGELGYAMPDYWIVLSILGLLSLALGLVLVMNSRWKLVSITAVLLALVIGQWRLLGFLIIPLLWRHGGFAP